MGEPEFGAWLANELVSMLEAMLAETELRAFPGEKIVEVKPVWAKEGEAFERLLTACSQPDLLFAAVTIAPMTICSSRCTVKLGRYTLVRDPPVRHSWYRILRACGKYWKYLRNRPFR
jgi:hypothetical protein